MHLHKLAGQEPAGTCGIRDVRATVHPAEVGLLDGADLLTAGTFYTANTTTGLVTNAAASATQILVGFTVQNDRLVLKGLA